MTNYNQYFEKALGELHRERRYRVFADLERIAGRFPHAYLALAGRPPRRRDLVLQRLPRHGAAPEGGGRDDRDRRAARHRRGRHPQHRRHQSSAGRARARARRPARQAGGAGLHLRLCVERDRHRHHRAAPAELPDPVRRAQPQFDDRGRQARRLREADLAAQRRRASRRAAASRRSGAAQADRVREPLFDGRRRRAGRRDLRPRREIRRDDLCR